MLYVCKNYPVCDSYVRVQPGTRIPMGTMANGELRRLRTEAHWHFDQLYKRGYMTKDDAYRWLASILCVPLNQAHIGMLGEYYCKKVIEESKKLSTIVGYPFSSTSKRCLFSQTSQLSSET